ncbi:hypothetical protein [Methylophaga sp.]|uniref:hypothetical protein n=1 Tax=Methylophaga sp. TaxID=2024840 RepID=UPI00272C1970|nr:hypothetical protein [Methylophaga sp.]
MNHSQTELDEMTNNLPLTSAKLMKFKLMELIDDVLLHDGFSDIRIEVKILKRGQKEVILHCGKQYRFVIDMQEVNEINTSQRSVG